MGQPLPRKSCLTPTMTFPSPQRTPTLSTGTGARCSSTWNEQHTWFKETTYGSNILKTNERLPWICSWEARLWTSFDFECGPRRPSQVGQFASALRLVWRPLSAERLAPQRAVFVWWSGSTGFGADRSWVGMWLECGASAPSGFPVAAAAAADVSFWSLLVLVLLFGGESHLCRRWPSFVPQNPDFQPTKEAQT